MLSVFDKEIDCWMMLVMCLVMLECFFYENMCLVYDVVLVVKVVVVLLFVLNECSLVVMVLWCNVDGFFI